ncbi:MULTISPECIES: ParA family protein [Komagataeibacter]|nr:MULTISPECIES: ParA family protein [Komagataeibacter]
MLGAKEHHHIVLSGWLTTAGNIMSIITVASFKGGPGKTTVCQILAMGLAERGVRVIVLDTDPTEAFSTWYEHTCEKKDFACIFEKDESKVVDLAYQKEEEYDLVIIDTAGFNNTAGSVSMTISNLVIVPVGIGSSDIDQAEKTIKHIEMYSKAMKRDIPTVALINRFTRTNVASHAVNELRELGIKSLDAVLGHRAPLAEISFSGVLPSSGTARTEIDALIDELAATGAVPSSKTVEVTKEN